MIAVSFIYPAIEGAFFDEHYYVSKHIPRVRELWEPLGLQLITPLARLEGAAEFGPFRALSMLHFDSLGRYNAALAKGGAELIADIANFTDIEPITQISRHI
jgi:uncharacterized protein (TIGR02118 family)